MDANQKQYKHALKLYGEWEKAVEELEAIKRDKFDGLQALYHKLKLNKSIKRLMEALASIEKVEMAAQEKCYDLNHKMQLAFEEGPL